MPNFSLGSVVATRGAPSELERLNVNPVELIGQHSLLDRGSLGSDDHEANARAVAEGSRILSAFVYGGVNFWVITEWNRSQTTLLLSDEY